MSDEEQGQPRVATYPQATIAKLLDLTPARISQLVKEGVIPRAERGRYELVPSVQGYIRFLRDRAVNADVGASRVAASRAQLMKARADMMEMERGRMVGELVPASDVERAWAELAQTIKTRVLAVPSKMAQQLAIERKPQQIEKLLREQLMETLRELSETEVDVDTSHSAPSDSAAH